MISQNMLHKIIFVGGVHGVGKTTLCKSLSLGFHIEHHSASGLISKLKQVHFTSKLTDNIEGNQDALIVAVGEFLNYDKYYLIDGHFCLINQDGNVIKIPLSIYTEMAPKAIILLQDNPEDIHRRLIKRDKEKFNVNFLRTFQEAEISYSETIAADLAIPYLQANPFTDMKIISNFVSSLLGKRGFR